MNLSIFSSDRGKRPGVLILLTLLAAFAAVELGMRFILVPKSQDLSRFSEYPAKAAKLHSKGGSNVALVGNSAIEAGIDPVLLERLLRRAGMRDVSAEMFAADASGITTWHYMVKNYFVAPGWAPRYLVLHYSGTLLVRDGNLEIGRLAQYFTKSADFREVIHRELSTGGDILKFSLSWGSQMFAFSPRLRDRALNAMIYDYKRFVRGNNQAALDHERDIVSRKGSGAASWPPDHSRLERFLKMVQQSETTLIVIAFPTQLKKGAYPYEINPQIRFLVESYGFVFKDLRRVEGLEGNMYEDSMHLNSRGRAVYTRILAREMFKTFSTGKKDPSF